MNTPTLLQRNPGLIRALQCFEAVARRKSLKLAAEELGVSQSAVSHQIRELTEVLGERLIMRSGRGISITPEGERLAEQLSTTFAGLQAAVGDVIGGGRQSLRLAICSSFGPGWLIPRLGRFIDAHPEVDLQLQLYAHDPLLTDTVADAIISALPVQRGFSSIGILDEMLVAVHARGRSAGRHRLITTDIEPGALGLDWQDYCSRAGLSLADLRDGDFLKASHYLIAQEMARAGLGIALVPDFLARREIDQGAVVLFDRTRLPSGRTYRLCYKHSRAQERGIHALARWLKRELEPEALKIQERKLA